VARQASRRCRCAIHGPDANAVRRVVPQGGRCVDSGNRGEPGWFLSVNVHTSGLSTRRDPWSVGGARAAGHRCKRKHMPLLVLSGCCAAGGCWHARGARRLRQVQHTVDTARALENCAVHVQCLSATSVVWPSTCCLWWNCRIRSRCSASVVMMIGLRVASSMAFDWKLRCVVDVQRCSVSGMYR